MSKVSVLIASRGQEPYLASTVVDLLAHAEGEVEVLIGLDGSANPADRPGEFTVPILPQDPRVKAFAWEWSGLKRTINRLALEAQGDYFLKTDAHCAFSQGWDVRLASECAPNWIIIPRFYVLDAEHWRWQDERFYDHFLLDCPLTDRHGYRFRAGGHWPQRTQARLHYGPLDESFSLHGSAWFVSRHHFLDNLHGMDPVGYGVMFMEPADLGLRTWLGPWDGKVMVRKDVWYAHMHKGDDHPRGFPTSWTNARKSYLWTANYWMRNCYPRQIHSMQWLVERFWPIPTWPEDWLRRQAEYERQHPNWTPDTEPAQ
jgi:glycosyltransferase involved in cell wall biosynthesis